MTDIKAELHSKLKVARGVMVAKLDGVSEYDARRPITASGTNLLGLVKHLIDCEEIYLGSAFGRPLPVVLPWVEDNSVWENADMWVKPEESREYILDLYDQACRNGDATIEALDLDAPGSVAHWGDAGATTLGYLLIRMVEETGHHAGHADILRELIDGVPGQADAAEVGDAAYWAEYVAKIQAAADVFGTS